MQYILAHDLGTTGNKSCLVDQNFEVVAQSFVPYPTLVEREGQAEQDPEDWWRAICNNTQSLISNSGVQKKNIAAISFSGQMMGCLPVDSHNHPLRTAIIWADQRSLRQADRLRKAFGGDENAYRLTGQKVVPTFSAAKILWVIENQPDIAKKTKKYLLCKDFLIARLCGEWVTDPSDASGTNMYNLYENTWLKDILDSVGIQTLKLSEIHPATYIAGRILGSIADEIGLLDGTPVVQGGADGECAAAGMGAVACGDAYLYLGSSGWLASVSSLPVVDPQMRFSTEAHVVPGLFSPNGTTQNCGTPYRWFRDTLQQIRPDINFEEMDRLATQSPVGANGLVFLPHILGERSPFVNLQARGVFLGLSQYTKIDDILRAIHEGVAFNFAYISRALAENGIECRNLSVMGGGTRSKILMQILADVLNTPLYVPEHIDLASSLGAALCGGIGVGLWKDFGSMRRLSEGQVSYHPIEKNVEIYTPLIEQFLKAYSETKDILV